MEHTPDNNSNPLADVYCQSLTTVEQSLLNLKETVCGWPNIHNDNLERKKIEIIEHLEEMLWYLQGSTSDNEDLAGEGAQDIENDGTEHHSDDTEVRDMYNLRHN